MSTTVFFSRFSDAPADAERPARRAELTTVHRHVLEKGRVLVMSWRWDETAGTFQQVAVVNAPAEHAQQWVPPGAVSEPVPSEFAFDAYASGAVIS